MTMPINTVPYPPAGLVLAIQYWPGDLERAMRLARLIADIEPAPRRDGTVLAFCRRNDMIVPSALEEETLLYCAGKFPMMRLHAQRAGVGHPQGCNELAASVIEQLATSWRAGRLSAQSVFLMEADGCPLSSDWLDRLRHEHQDALLRGKRVTGAYTEGTVPYRIPHINGSLIMHLSTWWDRMSLHETPAAEAWDLFHAAAIMQEARPTHLIRNYYGARDLSDGVLAAMGRETAFLLNVKDDSAIAWAKANLAADRAPKPRMRVAAGRDRPAGTVTETEIAAVLHLWPAAGGVLPSPGEEWITYDELAELLGHRPMTWRADAAGARE